MPRRTYIYYSDTKIVEQRNQVPPSRWKRAVERVAGVGVTVAGTGVSLDLRSPEEEPILRTMQTVCMDLGDEGRIGTFDEPKDYFYGSLVFYYDTYKNTDPPVIVLVGATDQTLVALGGSREHVRGFRGRQIPVEKDAPSIVMETDLAGALIGSELPAERRARIPSVGGDARAIYMVEIYKEWQGSKINKMEFEVLARKEGDLMHVYRHM